MGISALEISASSRYNKSANSSTGDVLVRNNYTDSPAPGGITSHNRVFLDLLNRKLRGPFTIKDTAEILVIDHKKASRLLAYWAEHGWLSRIRNGLYITVPLGALNPTERREDPWIIATRLFAPCYIGGWSACEHWGITEQLFKDIAVFSSHKVRTKEMVLQDTRYVITHVPENKMFGLTLTWRGTTRVSISDPSRTIIDILNDPSMGGGIRNIAEMVQNYFESDHKDVDRLLEYARRADNKSINKRLGFIIETLNLDFPDIIKFCTSNLSKGYSLLDTTIKKTGRLTRRWNLQINTEVEKRNYR